MHKDILRRHGGPNSPLASCVGQRCLQRRTVALSSKIREHRRLRHLRQVRRQLPTQRHHRDHKRRTCLQQQQLHQRTRAIRHGGREHRPRPEHLRNEERRPHRSLQPAVRGHQRQRLRHHGHHHLHQFQHLLRPLVQCLGQHVRLRRQRLHLCGVLPRQLRMLRGSIPRTPRHRQNLHHTPSHTIHPCRQTTYSQIYRKCESEMTTRRALRAKQTIQTHMEYISQEGYNKIESELRHLLHDERPRIAEAISEARDKGDLSENFEYHAAKREQGILERRIDHLKVLLSNARVMETTHITADTVQMLTTVQLSDLTHDRKMTYTIVSQSEANIHAGKISIKTPIAQGLMKKKVGDIAEIKVPAGVLRLRIDKISVSV